MSTPLSGPVTCQVLLASGPASELSWSTPLTVHAGAEPGAAGAKATGLAATWTELLAFTLRLSEARVKEAGFVRSPKPR